MQLAWNELCKLFGKDIVLSRETTSEADKTPYVDIELNKKYFIEDYLSANCYIARAGKKKDGITEKIISELKAKFNEESVFNLKLDNPDDILAYAFLRKDVAFETRFPKVEGQLRFFDYKDVKGFGTPSRLSSSTKLSDGAQNQVRILKYIDDNNFTIALEAKDDYIVLTKMPLTKRPLLDIINDIDKLNIEKYTQLDDGDKLIVPCMDFSIQQNFPELELMPIKETGYFIAKAVQDIKFSLNESGAKLRSEARLTCLKCCSDGPDKTRDFIFDEPFLIQLKTKKDYKTYFAGWIENSDLLVKA
jgi:hypothetical protein